MKITLTINWLFVLMIICPFLVQSCKEGTMSKSSQNIEVDKDTSIHKGIYIGMLGGDSVFINSEPSDGDWRVHPTIYLNNKVIYKETNGSKDFLISKSETKIVSLKNNIDEYILLTMVDPPFVDKWFILRVHNQKIEQTGSAIKEIFNDIDNDGYYEIGGRELTDAVCLDCDSILYQPYKIYKLGNELEFDSILSKNLTIKLYGTYLGPNYKDTVLQQKEKIDWNNTKLFIEK
jgi:hypothetical protein